MYKFSNYIAVVWAMQVCTVTVTQIDNATKDMLYGNLLVDVGYPKSGDIPVLNRKVFKASRVSIREHPYIASVRRMFAHYCTGSILTKNLIVSVAHPLADVPVTELGVVVGENYADRGSLVHTVILVIIHEDFDPYSLANDIALIRVYEDIAFKGSVKPIELVPPRDPLANNRAFVTGWGRCDSTAQELCLPRTSKYFPDEKIDPMLRSINFDVTVPSSYCERYERHGLILKPGMLCLGPAREEDPMSPCMAVPGAPLVIKARLAGLQSFGFGCTYHHDLPLIYTDIRHYQPWLVHNIPILRKIHKTKLTRIFQATRGYILAQWIIETRLVKPQLLVYEDKDIVPTELDKTLATLKGTVYDIRDFISGGIFHKPKVEMYENIRNELKVQVSTVHAPKPEKLHVDLHPFLSNDTLSEFLNTTDTEETEAQTNYDNITDIFYDTD